MDISRTPHNSPLGGVNFPNVEKFVDEDFYQKEINYLNKKILDVLKLDKQEIAEIYSECKRKIEELKDR